jgi:XTP/dITP diphosphohydrolase
VGSRVSLRPSPNGTASEVILLATRSAGKLRELRPLLSESKLHVESLLDAGLEEQEDEQVLEAFDTFEQNALAKARWFSARAGGRVVLADDSGLEVDALDGRPGVQSKRWAGSEAANGQSLDAINNAHLLSELNVAEAKGRTGRFARFVCAAACAWSGGSFVVRGVAEGRILNVPTGEYGFGYDPLFWSSDLQLAFGEVPKSVKEVVSHRGRAFRTLVALMRSDKSLSAKLFGAVDPAMEAG